MSALTLKKMSKIGALSALCSLTLMATSCPPPEKKASTSRIGVLVNDANGKAMTTTVQLKLTGTAAEVMTSIGADSLVDQTSANGVFSIAIDNRELVGQEVRVVTMADGYINSGKTILIPDGDKTVNISMVNIEKPPVAVAVAKQELKVDETGAIQEEVVLQTKPAAEASAKRQEEKVEVKLPAGTVMKDASGNPISGNVSLVATYHNAEEEESLETFPGGFNVSAEMENGEEEQISFTSAGFTSIEISNENGDQVKTFSDPIDVTVSIAKGLPNPKTGAAVAVGDVIPSWSYDKDTGEWSKEGEITVEADENGNLYGVMKVTHLSYWNLDWFSESCGSDEYPVVNLGSGAEGKVITIKRKGGESYTTVNGQTTVELAGAAGGKYTFTAYLGTEEVAGPVTVDLACGEEVSFPVVSLPTTLGTTVEAYLCEEDQPAANAFVTFTKVGNTKIGEASYVDDQGKLGIDLPEGDYTISVFKGGKIFNGSISAGGD